MMDLQKKICTGTGHNVMIQAHQVKNHIINYIDKIGGKFPDRKELLKYMNSNEFHDFIKEIDKPNINTQPQNSVSNIEKIQREMSRPKKVLPKCHQNKK